MEGVTSRNKEWPVLQFLTQNKYIKYFFTFDWDLSKSIADLDKRKTWLLSCRDAA